MFQGENLIEVLDKFKAAVYLKDINGRHFSMNKAGIDIMKGNHGRVLGKTNYELFDFASAKLMTESDLSVMRSGRIHTTAFPAFDRVTGETLHMFNAKSAVLSPTGQPLGVVGISVVNCKDLPLYSDLCRLLPQFVKRKQSMLLSELLELQTISEFFQAHRLH